MRLADKVAVISGAASGMGAATARMFAREGAKLTWREVIRNSGSGFLALRGIGMELHKRRRRFGCSSFGLGGLGRRGNPQ